ncbi:DUF4406 domain-containing protein [Vibrio cholerae]|nr:DUF4406 domain-containing protein [Vibrio cholerae]
MKRNIIYIAGPITTGGGTVEKNLARFHQAAQELDKQGYIVLNPATLPQGLDEEHYMDICCAMVRSADTLFMLKGWAHSDGANAEYALAVKYKKKTLFESEVDFRLPQFEVA